MGNRPNFNIDFGIKDFNFGGRDLSFTDIMNIGGMIGIKGRSMTIDYRIYNGDATFPSVKPENADSVANIPPNQPHINFGTQFSRVNERIFRSPACFD